MSRKNIFILVLFIMSMMLFTIAYTLMLQDYSPILFIVLQLYYIALVMIRYAGKIGLFSHPGITMYYVDTIEWINLASIVAIIHSLTFAIMHWLPFYLAFVIVSAMMLLVPLVANFLPYDEYERDNDVVVQDIESQQEDSNKTMRSKILVTNSRLNFKYSQLIMFGYFLTHSYNSDVEIDNCDINIF